MTVKGCARRLDLSEQRVRQLADAGLLAHLRTDSGVRLFTPDEVQRFAETRASK